MGGDQQLNFVSLGVDDLRGHADLQVLRRYLALTTDDIALAHRIGSTVDNNKL